MSLIAQDGVLCAWKKAQYNNLSAYTGRPVTLTFTARRGPDGYPTKFDIDGISFS